MKACVLHAINDLRYEDVPDPVRKHGEALIRIKAAGICGSDIPRVYEKGTYHFPTIPGHEFSGETIEADDAGIIGTKCAVFPIIPCRECESCLTGRYAQCFNYNYFGSRCDGGFAELISVPLWNIVPAPDGLDFEIIAMTEPCAVALHSLEQASFQSGASLCVFGAGPIGVMLGKWAVLKGASRVSLIDVDERKIDFARKLGFDTEITGKYDVVIEGSGTSAGYENAVTSAAPFGVVVLMGNPARDMTLSQHAYSKIMRDELTLKGTWNTSYNSEKNDWKITMENLAKLDISCLISHRFDFSRCNDAFSVLRERGEFVSKVMFVNN